MQRAITDMKAVDTVVADIVAEVRRDGDAALRRYAERFDGCRLDDLRVSTAEIYRTGECRFARCHCHGCRQYLPIPLGPANETAHSRGYARRGV